MKHRYFSLLLTLTVFVAKSQRPAPDTIPASNGPLIIRPIFHSALVIKWNGKTIYYDPYGGEKAFAGLDAPDLILISDIHGDHLNLETLGEINTSKATFAVPEAVSEKLPAELKKNLVIIKNGEHKIISEISVTAVPMYNLPESNDSRHIKGRGNGYVIEIGGKRIYFSGDTEDIPEMRELKNIDIALVCMNLPYTMDISQATDAVLAFGPKIVYPFHYRGKDGYSDTESFKEKVKRKNAAIEVRLRNWYPQY